MAILRTAGVARTLLLLLFVLSWGCEGEETIGCDADACGEEGGGGRGSSMACVGLGFCCAAITSSAGLGPVSTSKRHGYHKTKQSHGRQSQLQITENSYLKELHTIFRLTAFSTRRQLYVHQWLSNFSNVIHFIINFPDSTVKATCYGNWSLTLANRME